VARFKLFLPLGLFLALAILLARGLQLDPKALPSALIDQPLPEFSLPLLATAQLGGERLVNRGEVVGEVALFNVWATWCVSCRVEHPYLGELASRGVPIYGINYKDDASAARQWLQQLGDPYRLSIFDAEGSLGLDLGVYGAPETYVVDRSGVIRYRHVGVIDQRVWTEIIEPIVNELREEG
jgi:cytochrome c biogenesis protein CcmG/thiol:disulfide interchange protein DsbE